MSQSIVLTTLNARYHHTAFGLRYLYANLQELQPQATLLEFTIKQDLQRVTEEILAHSPQIVGLGVYIWNVDQMTQLAERLKAHTPQTLVVLGGPEVSYETETLQIATLADFIIQSEADLAFYEFCKNYLLNGILPPEKRVRPSLPEISHIQSPYSYYSDEDIKNRFIYVEASRGCPYKCEYCLSSLDQKVRTFPLDSFLNEMDHLIQRGARNFKFVDRTFNLKATTSVAILEFFLKQLETHELFLHFELVPDRLPDALKDLLTRFPPGSVQFEIGIQTWNPEVSRLVSRPQKYPLIEANLKYLRTQTQVHLHTDLIAGLPGEDMRSFAKGFDQLLSLEPHEIQVGILKRLKGTPITRHDETFKMVYSDQAPYEILSNSTLSTAEIQELKAFARFWNLIGNSGHFSDTIETLKRLACDQAPHSFFWIFMELSRFLESRYAAQIGVPLVELVRGIWEFTQAQHTSELEKIRVSLLEDYSLRRAREVPRFLKGNDDNAPISAEIPQHQKRNRLRARQNRQRPSIPLG